MYWMDIVAVLVQVYDQLGGQLAISMWAELLFRFYTDLQTQLHYIRKFFLSPVISSKKTKWRVKHRLVTAFDRCNQYYRIIDTYYSIKMINDLSATCFRNLENTLQLHKSTSILLCYSAESQSIIFRFVYFLNWWLFFLK